MDFNSRPPSSRGCKMVAAKRTCASMGSKMSRQQHTNCKKCGVELTDKNEKYSHWILLAGTCKTCGDKIEKDQEKMQSLQECMIFPYIAMVVATVVFLVVSAADCGSCKQQRQVQYESSDSDSNN